MSADPDRCSWRYRQDAVNAQPIPSPVPGDRDPIPVRCRVVWSVDGQTWLDGEAIRWTPAVVYVELHDPRSQLTGQWLLPADVRRR